MQRRDFLLPCASLLLCAVSTMAADGARAAAIAANTLLPWKGSATLRLALADLRGNPVDLARYRGKTVLVNFWATWCVPCREEMPSLAALAKTSGIAVLAVDVGETASRVERFLARYPSDLPILLDAHGEVAEAWSVSVYPSSYIIDGEGRVRAYIAGALDWQDPSVVRQVETAARLPAR
ncbi:MAG: TlpA disulfide reductase family protein [Casimicrobiaceae bacterium]